MQIYKTICPAVWLNLRDSHISDQRLLNHSLFALLISTPKNVQDKTPG